MTDIDFQVEDVAMPDFDPPKVRSWIEAVARSHGFEVGRLAFRFCSDPFMLKTNREFLNHDYFTDIITWDYTSGGIISGDIIISLDTVASNALLLGQDERRELFRVIIHGVLHLCGINDKGPGEREVMEAAEDAALNLLESFQ